MSAQHMRNDVRDWVFDLDNTLYPADSTMYDAIGLRMTRYIADAVGLDHDAAEKLQEHYFHEYGATVVGLVRHHGIDALDFMNHVHDVDASLVKPDPELRALLAALPGRKFVFTNGGGGHAERMVAQIGLDGVFDDLVDLQGTGLEPKPQVASYRNIIARCGLDARRAALIEDTLRNLEPAHALGFFTVLVGAVHPEPLPPYVDRYDHDVKAFLRAALAIDPSGVAA